MSRTSANTIFFFTKKKKKRHTVTPYALTVVSPWAQPPAEQSLWQAARLCWAWTPPSPVHRVGLLDTRWRSAAERGHRFCRKPSRDSLYLEPGTQKGEKHVIITETETPALTGPSVLGAESTFWWCDIYFEIHIEIVHKKRPSFTKPL